MPFEKLAEVVITFLITSSIMLVAAAIAWRLAVRPTLREFLDSRARAGADPVLSRRMTELEEEVRGLKERLTELPEGTPTRLTTGASWHGTKEKA